MGKIISFANQKGGVGKTTTCVNLAAYMALMGKRILVVDLDAQGNATTSLGVVKNNALKTLYNVIDGECDVGQVILHTAIPGLDVIPATVDLAGAELELVQLNARELVLKNILSEAAKYYDYVLIDCPPSLGLLTVNALTASNSVLIPIQCQFFALEGLSQLMNTIRLIKQHLNPALGIEGVVMTMKDNRSNLVQEVSDEIIKYFKQKVFNTVIPQNIKLAEAPSHGESIATYDYSSKGGDAYLKLAKELLERNKDGYKNITKNLINEIRRRYDGD